jgi:hypothetical protein
MRSRRMRRRKIRKNKMVVDEGVFEEINIQKEKKENNRI